MSVRATSEVLSWWLGLTGLWLLTLSTPSVPELAAAAVTALTCAFAARAARRALTGVWHPRIRWLRWVVEIPWTALRESALALVEVFRRPDAGRFTEVELPDEAERVQAARAAVAAVVVGCTPGTMVVTGQSGKLVVHRLLEGDSPLLDRVTR